MPHLFIRGLLLLLHSIIEDDVRGIRVGVVFFGKPLVDTLHVAM